MQTATITIKADGSNVVSPAGAITTDANGSGALDNYLVFTAFSCNHFSARNNSGVEISLEFFLDSAAQGQITLLPGETITDEPQAFSKVKIVSDALGSDFVWFKGIAEVLG
jgi:hypothetical protein